MTLALNGERFVLLRLERGLAIRQLALDSGIDIAVLNRLDAGGISRAASLTLGQFLRLAESLGTDPGDLLRVEPNRDAPPHTPAEDAALLGAVLYDVSGQIPMVVVAAALGWTLPHTHLVTDALVLHLAPAGLTVHRDSGRMFIRATNDKHADAALAVRINPRARPQQRIITPAGAKLAYNAMQQPLSQHALSHGERMVVAMLVRASILRLDDARDVAVTSDVLDSLYPD